MIPSTVDTNPLQGAPVGYLVPEVRPTLSEAQAWCRNLKTSRYESLYIAAFCLPKKVRLHLESIYAYCRLSDDLGDEVEDTETALRLLYTWEGMLNDCYDVPERSMHPVFVALRETIVSCDLPRQLFLDLLHAFKLDQVKTDYGTWDELMEYSRYSANPVGRLVLWVCGYRDETLGLLSDKVCTALQLANFWQDVVENAERGRRYLPAESLARFGVDEGQILGRVFTPDFRAMMLDLVARTRKMLLQGGAISEFVDRELRVTLDLCRKSGEATLDGIAAQDYDVLGGRPVVTKVKQIALLIGALAGKAKMGFAR